MSSQPCANCGITTVDERRAASELRHETAKEMLQSQTFARGADRARLKARFEALFARDFPIDRPDSTIEYELAQAYELGSEALSPADRSELMARTAALDTALEQGASSVQMTADALEATVRRIADQLFGPGSGVA